MNANSTASDLPSAANGSKVGQLTEHARSARSAASKAEAMDLRSLFEAHYASMWRLLRRLGVRPAQLDDATQEVFWVAARRLNDIQPGREHSFLYGAALRIAAGELRRQKTAMPLAELEQIPLLVDQCPSPEEQIAERQAREILDDVLNRMPWICEPSSSCTNSKGWKCDRSRRSRRSRSARQALACAERARRSRPSQNASEPG